MELNQRYGHLEGFQEVVFEMLRLGTFLHPKQPLIARLVKLLSQGIQTSHLIKAIVRLTPLCSVMICASWVKFSDNGASGGR